ncbi:MAG: DUF3943 domain-containing protein [Oligoflexia bacterium]|nr:DUF3943 domain-containing protein [Oligoflexia bacterium]
MRSKHFEFYFNFLFFLIFIEMMLLLPTISSATSKEVSDEVSKEVSEEASEAVSTKTAKEESNKNTQEQKSQLQLKYIYTYKDREHTNKETLTHLGVFYLINWGAYYLSQPQTFAREGSWSNYKNNFGKAVFDKDEPYWNWTIHPMTGSQLYLYYRANGYSRINSFALTAVQSALFEFTIEIYTEPASIQDMYQTPVLGSILGVVLEKVSLLLLNTDVSVLKVVGHILNPTTLFWFYEGKVAIYPSTIALNAKKVPGVLVTVEF